MIYILGSGPAAVAALAACIEKKVQVTVLDIGFTADSTFKEETTVKKKSKIPLKKVYGSDYPYWDIVPKTYKEDNQTEALNSHALGGLSNTWGAGILPYTKEEFKHWPISYEELAPYYKKLDSFVPMVAKEDVLKKDFPLFHDHFTELKSSSQFQKLLHRIQTNEEKLIVEGISIGKARMAIDQTKVPCSYCGKCIEGCPDYLIYSSAFSLKDFLKYDTVNYIDGIQVEKISSRDGKIVIEGYDLKNKQSVNYAAEKVYVGCGVLSSTKIMMRSLGIYNKEVIIKDSQYFIFPMLGSTTKNILKENVYTLAEAFCEVENENISPHRIHLSLYGYSPFLKNYVYAVFGVFHHLLKPFLDFFLKRMYIAQGFIHSDHSNQIVLTMVNDGIDRIAIRSNNCQKPKTLIKKVVSLLNKNYKSTGLFGVSPVLQIAPVGKSYHTGGSMPMKSNPIDEMDTNRLGETKGLPNVHVIDSSVFTDVPGGPIVQTMMANAYRIVDESLNN